MPRPRAERIREGRGIRSDNRVIVAFLENFNTYFLIISRRLKPVCYMNSSNKMWYADCFSIVC